MDPAYWLVVIVVGIVAIILYQKQEKEKAEREAMQMAVREKELEVAEIASKLQVELNKIESLKGSAARINHCKKAVELLRATDAYWPVNKDVIQNYDNLKARLESMQRVFPVIEHVEKAYKARFKGKEALELNALTDALYAVQTNQVTNEDIQRAEVFPEGAFGEIVQIEDIAQRAKELGWDGPKDGSTIPV